CERNGLGGAAHVRRQLHLRVLGKLGSTTTLTVQAKERLKCTVFRAPGERRHKSEAPQAARARPTTRMTLRSRSVIAPAPPPPANPARDPQWRVRRPA